MALTRKQTLLVEVVLLDRTGNSRQTSFRLLSGLSLGQIDASTQAVRNAILGISDAVITTQRIIWQYVESEAIAPSSDTNVRVITQLFYTNKPSMFSFDIPSVRNDLFVTDGRYAGFKVDLRQSTVLARIANLTQALKSTVSETGEARDPFIVSGGRGWEG